MKFKVGCLLALGVVSTLFVAACQGAIAEAVGNVPARYLVTPQQFGAKADGATDDTATIQKAINAVFQRGGGIVFFPRGVYVLGKPPVTHDLHGNNPDRDFQFRTTKYHDTWNSSASEIASCLGAQRSATGAGP